MSTGRRWLCPACEQPIEWLHDPEVQPYLAEHFACPTCELEMSIARGEGTEDGLVLVFDAIGATMLCDERRNLRAELAEARRLHAKQARQLQEHDKRVKELEDERDRALRSAKALADHWGAMSDQCKRAEEALAAEREAHTETRAAREAAG